MLLNFIFVVRMEEFLYPQIIYFLKLPKLLSDKF